MAYIGKSPTGTGVRSRFHFTATGSETSLSGADDNGKTLVFADGEYVDVYVNGVLLFDGDYNTTTANTIGGLAALAANDVVEIVVYDIFSVADTVSAKNGGTFSSDVAVNGDISATDGTFSGDIKIGNDTDRTSYLTETNANLQIGGGVIFEAGSGNNAEILNYRTTSMVFGNGGSEDMRLDGSGNLGIGDAPDKTLHVSKANSEFRIDNAGAEEYTVSTGAVDGAIFHTYYDRGGSTYIDSISRATTHQWRGSDGNEDMRIDSNGNVGIGTSTTGDSGLVVYNTNAATIYKNSTTGTGTSDGFYVGMGKTNSADGYVYNRENNPIIFGTNNAERLRVSSSGNVYIGNGGFDYSSDSFAHFHNPQAHDYPRANFVKQYSGNVYGLRFYHQSSTVGGITYSNTATAFLTSSDHRLKENVEDMTGAITRVKNLQPKRFNFISDTTDTLVDGFMAHEAQLVVPEAVTGTHNEVDDDGNPVYQGIDQAKLVPLLTGALQEAITKIEALETEMTALKARVTTLENA